MAMARSSVRAGHDWYNVSVGYPTKLLLAYRSGDTCALPGCKAPLTPESSPGNLVNAGEAAHIAGENDGSGSGKKSARYDPSMTPDQRDHYNNLLYLCPRCHTIIDAIPQGEADYPVAKLRIIKSEHESSVRSAMLDAFAEVGFAELQEATNWIAHINPSSVTTDYSVLDVIEKLRKNAIDDNARAVISMGMSVANDVLNYVESVAQTDSDFPERLKAGFLEVLAP